MNKLEATYLAWVDARETGIENLAEHLLKHGIRVVEDLFLRVKDF
jgi:bifunctional pyridoxal-dependent enzyme with beta-cystathionase and maltose regulon repressor activities